MLGINESHVAISFIHKLASDSLRPQPFDEADLTLTRYSTLAVSPESEGRD